MYDTDNIFFDGHPSKDTMDCTTVYVSWDPCSGMRNKSAEILVLPSEHIFRVSSRIEPNHYA